MAIFNLLASDIKNLELKLEGKLPIDRDELLALANSWGRLQNLYTLDKDGNDIKIIKCEENEKFDLSKLDVSKITNFNDIFTYSNYNGNINLWDVSNGISMEKMFAFTKNFNSTLNSWDVSNVTSMFSMFSNAEKFNQNLNNWNVSKVKDMSCMFYETKKFNQPLDKWNISMVTSLKMMFTQAIFFNQPLDKWDVSKVLNISYMFYETKDFNQILNSWDISNVIDMNYIFAYSKSFNQPVLWDLSKIEKCYGAFYDSKIFKDKFNEGKELPRDTNEIKKWLIENRDRMIALDVEYSKGKELDKFLLNINVITSTKLNGLHNNENIIIN